MAHSFSEPAGKRNKYAENSPHNATPDTYEENGSHESQPPVPNSVLANTHSIEP